MIREGLCITLAGLTLAGWAYWITAWTCARKFFSGRPRALGGDHRGGDSFANASEGSALADAVRLGRGSRTASAKADPTETLSPDKSRFVPSVSILKPVKGADAGAYENFASFCTQDYDPYEVLFAVAALNDPAIAVVKRLIKDFPRVPIRWYVAAPLGANPKCANLHRLAAEATGEVLVLSDCDIRVTPDYLARVVKPLADPSVGIVTCPYYGAEPAGLWARLEALHMEVVFLPAVILAHRLGQRVGLGATLVLRRRDLFRAGGFAAIADVLMDDYHLTAQIEKLGLRTCVSDYVVGSVLGKISFWQCWNREVRWARGIRVTAPGKYWGLLLTYPTPWAIALVIVAGLRSGSLLLFVLTLMMRSIISWDVMRSRAAGACDTSGSLSPVRGGEGWGEGPNAEERGIVRNSTIRPSPQPSPPSTGEREQEVLRPSVSCADIRNLLLLPLRDVMSLAVWCAGLVGSQIVWRRQRFVLQRDGRLVPTPERKEEWFNRAVRRIDRFLREREGIFEFCGDADCILRISLSTCEREIRLADGTCLLPGDAMCDLHLYNEHIPPIGSDGPDIAWASLIQGRFRNSLSTLAATFEKDTRFDSVKGLRGRTTLVTHRGNRQLQRLAARLDFELVSDLGRSTILTTLHDLGENFLVWALLRTFNPGGLRHARLMRVRQTFYISREKFSEIYDRSRQAAPVSEANELSSRSAN